MILKEKERKGVGGSEMAMLAVREAGKGIGIRRLFSSFPFPSSQPATPPPPPAEPSTNLFVSGTLSLSLYMFIVYLFDSLVIGLSFFSSMFPARLVLFC